MEGFNSMPTAPRPAPITIPHPTNAKYQKIPKTPTNELGQATKLDLCSCNTRQTVTFHITWMTFWLCFFVWFCTANIYHQISSDFNLTFGQHQLAGTISVTSTVFFRLIIADLCFKYGPRVSYVIVLISTTLSLFGMALVQSATGYIIFHLFLGIAGASFVVTQYHITRMFSPHIVGFSQATAAGFGNFGGGCANFVMPLLVRYSSISWRWFMFILAAVAYLFCLIYYVGTADHPKYLSEHKEAEEPHFPIDLIEMDRDAKHVPPDKQIRIPLKDAVTNYRTWILFLCYAACFGVEITFYLVGAHYFASEYDLDEVASGLVVMMWSSMNLFARPFGGWMSDKFEMVTRVKILFVLLFCESIFLILFGMIGGLSIGAAIAVSLLFSVCVQMAEGVVFNMTPFIQPKSVGHVIGIVGTGSDGILGAVFFMFGIFMPWQHTDYDVRYTWIIVGGIVMMISFAALTIKFSEREVLETKQNEQACYDLGTLDTDGSRSDTDVA
eukprot:114866_1